VVLFEQCGQGLSNMSKARDELSLITQDTKCASHLSDSGELSGPVFEAISFGEVNAYCAILDVDAEVFYSWLFKLALGQFQVHVMLLNLFEDHMAY
jgi:hypothetical protein